MLTRTLATMSKAIPARMRGWAPPARWLPAARWLLSAAAGLAMLPHFIGSEDIIALLPGFLLFMMGYWQISPVLTMSLGVSLEFRKVSVYPVEAASTTS